MTVATNGFFPGPVEIRWGTTEGPQLGTAQGTGGTGKNFVTVTTPPDAPGGVYYIVAYQEVPGSSPLKAADAFTVIPPQAQSSPGPGQGGASNPGGDPAASTPGSDQTAGADQPRGGPGAAQPGAGGGPAPAGAAGGTGAGVSPGSGGTFAIDAPAAAAQGAQPDQGRVPRAAGSSPPQTRAPAEAAPTQERRGTEPAVQPVVPASPESVGGPQPAAAPPAGSSVSGDLWSGFREGDFSSIGATVAGGSERQPSAGAGLGLALLAAGVASLLLGFGLMEARRARARRHPGGT